MRAPLDSRTDSIFFDMDPFTGACAKPRAVKRESYCRAQPETQGSIAVGMVAPLPDLTLENQAATLRLERFRPNGFASELPVITF